MKFVPFLLLLFFAPSVLLCQRMSIARQWNEVLLHAIERDYARPTLHARNLYHVSAAMYDSWALFDPTACPVFVHDSIKTILVRPAIADVESCQAEAISFAAYRVIRHRFKNSPGRAKTFKEANETMYRLGFDTTYTSTDYRSDQCPALGNMVADLIIRSGLQDGANELENYAFRHYAASNPSFKPLFHGNLTIKNPNRWQPLDLNEFVDQSGQVVKDGASRFIGPEWGLVTPFAIDQSRKKVYQRDSINWTVYHDPGLPPNIRPDGGDESEEYAWNFALVAIWSSHLDPADSALIDISPASRGNVTAYPTNLIEYRKFYDLYNGGSMDNGHKINPAIGLPYRRQMVKRGDFVRVLAEFWADGPNSLTPPGHWFQILNYVTDHPAFSRPYETVKAKSDLEWDVKAYLTLGGAMHDAAVTAWSIKGYYDYVRPVSAFRYMVLKGQRSDESLTNYHPEGIPLFLGYIEVVRHGDHLAGFRDINVGKIKVKSWRGPKHIIDPRADQAGVGWILAENWLPYQRPTFVTPPFAGYVSGHSTFSSAAADVLTALTGSEYFPGGLAEFTAKKNEFLVFEEGPSTDIVLQWATFRDASDQCSLSRIWGGIHPPSDDIPGRIIGRRIAADALTFASRLFNGRVTESSKASIHNSSTDSKGYITIIIAIFGILTSLSILLVFLSKRASLGGHKES
ncbi:MAG TPA: vanadium-dependent haloperoxidase [Cyclobacteriaceae bacterium]|nr:vanadium-dependent haloperoxidase [Cyclobacteriaceae bacterium]